MDNFRLTKNVLCRLPTAIQKGVLIALLELADEDGAVSISVRHLASDLGMSYQTLRTTLNHLLSNAVINAEPNANLTQRLTQLRIYNIGSYAISSRSSQRKPNADANARANAKKDDKFVPPEITAVRSYLLEKRYHFDPESFISHYESKGWKVGDQPMKNWKAACTTWETRWKLKYGEKFYYQIQQSNGSQGNSLARIRDAATAILQQPGNVDAFFDDSRRHSQSMES